MFVKARTETFQTRAIAMCVERKFNNAEQDEDAEAKKDNLERSEEEKNKNEGNKKRRDVESIGNLMALWGCW
jgi:hypothetical protein